MDVRIRPMAIADIEGAGAVVMAADAAADAKAGRQHTPPPPEEIERFAAGTRRFIGVDPGGACVAEDDASEFVMSIWPKLLGFLNDLFSPLRNKAARAPRAD